MELGGIFLAGLVLKLAPFLLPGNFGRKIEGVFSFLK
jgi:hypothetical protein